MYKAVIIGSGARAPAFIEAYRLLPEASVVAVSDRSGARSGPLAERYGIKAYTDARTMIQREKPDIVHIVTMPDNRVELMSLVADLNVPLCTVEKPVALEVADWKKLVRLEVSSSTRFAVSHQFRWHPIVNECREAIKSGYLGDLQLLELSSRSVISDQGTHILNYGMSLMDNARVAEVFGNAEGWSSDPGHPGPLSAVAQLNFENGVRGLWTAGAMAPICGDPETDYQHIRVSAHLNRGRVLYEMFGKWEIVSNVSVKQGDYGGMAGWERNNRISQAGFHQAMLNWLADDEAVPGTDLKQSLHEWSVVLALYESVVERHSVKLADFEPADDLLKRMKDVCLRK